MADEAISLSELSTFSSSLGFDDCAVTHPQIPEADQRDYLRWLDEGAHGDLTYMENRMRLDPLLLFPAAKSAIIFVSHYGSAPSDPPPPNSGKVASYAKGVDYHNVHRRRLKRVIHWLEEKSNSKGIAIPFSDSKPIMEKALAVQAGLGWMGKNTLLIHRRLGTQTLLAGCLTSLTFSSLSVKERAPRCGSCTRCIDHCPTQALTPYRLDAKRCLSYWTIEAKTMMPDEISERNPGYIFGCDICQTVCPHNRKKELPVQEEFQSVAGFGTHLDEPTIRSFREDPTLLFGTALKRKGAEGLYQNWQKLFRREGE